MFKLFKKKETAKAVIQELEAKLEKEKLETIRRHTASPVWLKGEHLQIDEMTKRGN